MSNDDDIANLNGGKPITTTEENTGGRDFEPIPPGWYPVECQKSEVRDTHDKKGKYLWLQCAVIGERYKARTLFIRLTLVNANAEAVKIGQRDLGFLGQSIGMPTGVKGSKELIGARFDARVVIKKATEKYPADNDVTGFETLGKKSSEPQAATTQKPYTEKAAGQARAWDKPSPPPAAATPPPATQAPAAPAATTTAPATAPAKTSRPWERK